MFASKSFAFYVETLNLLAKLVIELESGKLYLEMVKDKVQFGWITVTYLTLFPEMNKMLNMQRCIDVKICINCIFSAFV